MSRCGEFASHRFKAYEDNTPVDNCVRCGKVHADVERARRYRDKPQSRVRRHVVPTEIGQRLMPSERGMWQIQLKPTERATVVGFGRRATLIRVIKDGRKTPTLFHVDFWRVCEEQG